MAHARALLTSTPQGVTAYAELDMHHTDGIPAAAHSVLDFRRPIANLTTDGTDTQTRAKIAQVQHAHTDDGPSRPRSRAQFAKFFDGLDETLARASRYWWSSPTKPA